ncbi:MAG TPA: antitoxin Xre/MbcA/ParS toxin-binding domain-containing protein [Thermoanaerobaculia bacterium]
MSTEERDALLIEIADIVQDPDLWLDTPNDRFGGEPPRTLLESEKGRAILHDLVQAVKHGMVT